MMDFFKRKTSDNLSEEAQLKEIDERHYLSQQIFLRREALSWSQDEVARRAGLTQPQVAALEAGQANPTLRTLSKLAAAFSCGVTQLLEDPEPPLDGCTQGDREAAEELHLQASPLYSWDDPRWDEERQASEFELMEQLGIQPMPPSGQGPFQAFLLRCTLMRNQQNVSVEDDRISLADLQDYDNAITEL